MTAHSKAEFSLMWACSGFLPRGGNYLWKYPGACFHSLVCYRDSRMHWQWWWWQCYHDTHSYYLNVFSSCSVFYWLHNLNKLSHFPLLLNRSQECTLCYCFQIKWDKMLPVVPFFLLVFMKVFKTHFLFFLIIILLYYFIFPFSLKPPVYPHF